MEVSMHFTICWRVAWKQRLPPLTLGSANLLPVMSLILHLQAYYNPIIHLQAFYNALQRSQFSISIRSDPDH